MDPLVCEPSVVDRVNAFSGLRAALALALCCGAGCASKADLDAAYERGYAAGKKEAELGARGAIVQVRSSLDECREEYSMLLRKTGGAPPQQVARRDR